MPIPVAVFSVLSQAAHNSKESALKDLPALFTEGRARALVFASPAPEEDLAEITAAINAAAPSAFVSRITREELIAAGIPILPVGVDPSKLPPGTPKPDPAVFMRIHKEKLAVLS